MKKFFVVLITLLAFVSIQVAVNAQEMMGQKDTTGAGMKKAKKTEKKGEMMEKKGEKMKKKGTKVEKKGMKMEKKEGMEKKGEMMEKKEEPKKPD
jgi:hypothetical protein